MSLRASVTSDLYFDNVRLPDSARPPHAQAPPGPPSCLKAAIVNEIVDLLVHG
jgi:glutaryl-CoA dehydrogenase